MLYKWILFKGLPVIEQVAPESVGAEVKESKNSIFINSEIHDSGICQGLSNVGKGSIDIDARLIFNEVNQIIELDAFIAE